MIEARTLPGFMQLLPEDQILFDKIKNVIESNYKSFGFVPLDTPVLEASEILLAKAGGETEKQIYEFKKGDNNLCMRFDLTVPLAKYVAENFNELSFPFKRYQIGKVYRGERPQKGRYREFYQCDIDVIGRDKLSLDYDAEIPSIIYSVFKELDIGKFTINISNRKILLGFLEELKLENISTDVLRLIDKFEKIGKENFAQSLKKDLNLSEEKINSILSFIEISGDSKEQLSKLKNLKVENENFNLGIEELDYVFNRMKSFGIEDDYVRINLLIARGLDYYTGTVYETFLDDYKCIGSVSSGGRYDNLAGYYTKEKLPGVGMSIGLTRLFTKLKENELLKGKNSVVAKVIVLPMGETKEECIKISNILRKNNISNFVLFEDMKFKNKIVFANKQNAEFVLIIGEDEINNKKYSLKNLNTFEQQQLEIEKIIEILK